MLYTGFEALDNPEASWKRVKGRKSGTKKWDGGKNEIEHREIWLELRLRYGKKNSGN
jgi:hypothetical protein